MGAERRQIDVADATIPTSVNDCLKTAVVKVEVM